MTGQRGEHTPIHRLVVLGARGDLASRHTLAALAHLETGGLLPNGLDIVAVDRSTSSTSQYRETAAQLLGTHAAAVPEPARQRLVERLHYRTADVAHATDLEGPLGDQPCVVYFALPPEVVPAAAEALRGAGLAAGSRVLVEKPFGTDRTSAAALEGRLTTLVEEPAVFRADHFLHHQLLRDVLAVRSGSGLLEPLWHGQYVERVDVMWEEDAPVTGRGSFYDRTGALRDMVQSHLLQLLAAVAMEIPTSFESSALRAARADALTRVVAPDPEEVAVRTARGRYVAGTIRRAAGSGTSREVCAYVEEPGVDPLRLTETYARVDLRVAGERWHGVPFSLRTGRAIGSPRRQVQVTFRPRSVAAEGAHGRGPTLTFHMSGAGQPGATRFSLAPDPATGVDMSPFEELSVERPGQQLPASALMLRDALQGEARWFLSAEEVDQSWRVVDSVVAAWRSARTPLVDYPAGSAGPEPDAPQPFGGSRSA